MYKTALTLIFSATILFALAHSDIMAFQQNGPQPTIVPAVAQSQGQDPFANRRGQRSGQSIKNSPFAQTRNSNANNLYYDIASGYAMNGRRSEMSEAIQAMKEAEGDSERRDAERKVKELLVEQYQMFLVENEEQIEELQERLDNLKEQLERRRRAQDKMVELEFKRVMNASEGLVWPGQSKARTIWSRGSSSPARLPGITTSRFPSRPDRSKPPELTRPADNIGR